ncbi:MAG TPA: hypothetical protein VK031_07175 [Tissierellaceae bacterium]|nr:hypothetical protein [Tissierellaceae bacterium]
MLLFEANSVYEKYEINYFWLHEHRKDDMIVNYLIKMILDNVLK